VRSVKGVSHPEAGVVRFSVVIEKELTPRMPQLYLQRGTACAGLRA
jgi:hypothetical protein